VKEYPSQDEAIRLRAYRLMSERGYLKRVAKAGSELARWRHYIEQLGRPGTLPPTDPLVQPRIFPRMEGLQTPPWRDSNQISASAILEKAAATIRREIETVEGSQHFNYTGGILGSGQWSVMPIFVFGEETGPLVFSKTLFPKTTQTIRSLPDVCDTFPLADIIFSAHAPKTRLVPHFSWDPFRLRLHLGIRCPKNCGIRVGSESRKWQEGKVLAFHDSCEHRTWNDSDETRVVLIVDVWHPDLTLIEREAILACFRKKEIRSALMRSRAPLALQPILDRKFAELDTSDPLVAEYWER